MDWKNYSEIMSHSFESSKNYAKEEIKKIRDALNSDNFSSTEKILWTYYQITF